MLILSSLHRCSYKNEFCVELEGNYSSLHNKRIISIKMPIVTRSNSTLHRHDIHTLIYTVVYNKCNEKYIDLFNSRNTIKFEQVILSVKDLKQCLYTFFRHPRKDFLRIRRIMRFIKQTQQLRLILFNKNCYVITQFHIYLYQDILNLINSKKNGDL